jgi:uncharacterized SAM-binding protein YcdF (DUF218 family)
MNAQWDTSWLIWMAILIAIAAAAWITAIVAGIITLKTRGSSGAGTLIAAVIAALIVGGIGTWTAFPFSGQYHRYVPESGVVTAVGSRFLASDTNGGGSTQKFVVTFTDGRSYGCLDTRCANVTKGDHLTLLCEREFQFNAPNEGWNCNWGIDRKADGEIIP